jgi:alkanesulfonate monooxygenase SsuD/methylene tetrahydromethanopterin reductase-like flavin-dependent oxidoreductase (luciferase family)
MDADTLCDRGVIIAGDPDSCIKGVQLYEDIGVDQVILIMQTETIPHERVLQSIELFGKYVLPAFGKGVKKAQPVAAAR